MASKIELTVEDILGLLDRGVLGYMETRDLLAEIFPSFGKARSTDVDQYLEELGQKIDEAAAIRHMAWAPSDRRSTNTADN